jgi:hypothetical protein
MGASIISTIYIVVGVIIAMANGYFVITSVSGIISFLLAVILWPLIFLGLNLHLNLGF